METNISKPTFVDPDSYDNVGDEVVPRPRQQCSSKSKHEDFNYKVFDQEEDAQKFAIEEPYKIKLRKCRAHAPRDMCPSTDNDPTLEYVCKRQWGLNSKQRMRQVRLNTGQICIYWRPSFFTRE